MRPAAASGPIREGTHEPDTGLRKRARRQRKSGRAFRRAPDGFAAASAFPAFQSGDGAADCSGRADCVLRDRQGREILFNLYADADHAAGRGGGHSGRRADAGGADSGDRPCHRCGHGLCLCDHGQCGCQLWPCRCLRRQPCGASGPVCGVCRSRALRFRQRFPGRAAAPAALYRDAGHLEHHHGDLPDLFRQPDDARG